MDGVWMESENGGFLSAIDVTMLDAPQFEDLVYTQGSSEVVGYQ